MEALSELFSWNFLTPIVRADMTVLWKFIPFVLFFEVPVYLMVFLGVVRATIRRWGERDRTAWYPSVSCIVTCYSEGAEIRKTIRSICTQIYPGSIQLVVVIDGADQNRDTYDAAQAMRGFVSAHANRSIIVVPKWQRGGRVSTLNTGLKFSTGKVIMALDGDTSFDNNMVERATRHFQDPSVACVSGSLRVRNVRASIVTRMQAIEYFLSIHASKTGLSEFNLVNNISGAFGIFRRSILELIVGWDAGTAEDLDLTLRVKSYFGRQGKKMRIVFDSEAIGHTDVPVSMLGFLRQRLRWDGDLSFIYFRKHRKAFSPRILGWPNFLYQILSGLMFQIMMPILLLIYTVYLFIAFPIRVAVSLMVLVYLFYLTLTLFIWISSVLMLSERLREDLKLTVWLPLFPLFAFVTRLNSCFATFWELWGHGHADTSMAPWWVTRKSKF